VTAVLSVAVLAAARTDAAAVEAVFPAGQPGVDAVTRRLVTLIEPGFLAEVGWDAQRLVMCPPAGHPLLGRPVCRVEGCSATASSGTRICFACLGRLAERGLGADEVGVLPPRSVPTRGGRDCRVPGCARQRVSARLRLCRSHLDQRDDLQVEDAELTADDRFRPLPACGPCGVAACERQRRHRDGVYCDAHQFRRRAAKRREPGLDERAWRRTETPIGVGGLISFRGLAPRVVAQLLVGLQYRCRLDGVKTKEGELRAFCNGLRRQQVTDIGEHELPTDPDGTFRALVQSVARHAGRALATPETEIGNDVWDLAVFGQAGTLDFTKISQRWLREAAKRWAADDLPRHRSRAHKAGQTVRHHIRCVDRLSESLRMRPDRGDIPAALGRGDVEAFLNRLAYQHTAGQITGDARIRACREVRSVLTRIRTLGLTRPGQIAAGLGEDFTVFRDDTPDTPDPAEPDRDLPPEILQQLCAHLPVLTSPDMRTGIELAIDTGRRPEEVCALRFDCLARDADGLPVLVYDNHKANRPRRRLPIGESTARLIVAQQQLVRARFPHTPVGDLALLPTDRRNPNGRKPITAFSLAFHHRAWVKQMPILHTAEGTEFDKARIVLYAYRHSYAQRHADAGVGIDVLRQLMSHQKLDTTTQYYRIGHDRRRDAVDRVAALQFDRHGNRVWQAARQLLDSEHARRAVGEVAVPFGTCAEPSNVKAGGNACPYRFRCAGCDHFRTDISYLPDLQAHLDDLLRNRERVLASTDLDEWARTEALPSDAEITRIRGLITRIKTGLDDLTPQERRKVDDAVATVRGHRAVMLGMPRVRPTPPDHPERTA
jgi:integrase